MSAVIAFGDSSNQALVIVDMQPKFAQRYLDKEGNGEKLQALIEKQKQMIDSAKQRGIPILIVEYGNVPARPGYNANKYEPTNSEILQRIGDYGKTATVFKTQNGLFHPDNISREAAKQKLKEWGTTDLIVTGANGDGCVRDTIDGALASKYNVWAYSDGIADFNDKSFIYPYSYSEREPQRLRNPSHFHEFSDPNDVFPSAQTNSAGAEIPNHESGAAR